MGRLTLLQATAALANGSLIGSVGLVCSFGSCCPKVGVWCLVVGRQTMWWGPSLPMMKHHDPFTRAGTPGCDEPRLECHSAQGPKRCAPRVREPQGVLQNMPSRLATLSMSVISSCEDSCNGVSALLLHPPLTPLPSPAALSLRALRVGRSAVVRGHRGDGVQAPQVQEGQRGGGGAGGAREAGGHAAPRDAFPASVGPAATTTGCARPPRRPCTQGGGGRRILPLGAGSCVLFGAPLLASRAPCARQEGGRRAR